VATFGGTAAGASSTGSGGAFAPGLGAPANGGGGWSELAPAARAVLTALIDGRLLTPGRLAAATELPPADLDAALLDLELSGLVRRTAAGIQAIGVPGVRGAAGRPSPLPEPRAPPPATRPVELPPPAGVLECGGSGEDDDGDE
jgi:DprA winged helix domain